MHVVHDADGPAAPPITFDDFLMVDVRAGTILTAAPVRKARNPCYALTIDFGRVLGVRRSVARLTERYTAEGLVGRQILAVVNLPPRQVADAMSDVLVMGCPDAVGAIILAQLERIVANGSRLS